MASVHCSRIYSLLCLLVSASVTPMISMAKNTDFINVSSATASDWLDATSPPAGWNYEGAEKPTLKKDEDGAAVIVLPNEPGELTKLSIPYAFLGVCEEAQIEIRIGATSIEGRGLNWFLKKGPWELRADNGNIYLHNPETKARKSIGSFEPDTIQTIRLNYNVPEQSIVAIWVDDVEAEGATPYFAPSLATGGSLDIYATTNSGTEVLFAGLTIDADAQSMDKLPRWNKPERAEVDTKEPVKLLRWEPYPEADQIIFEINPDRLADPAFDRGILFSREDFGNLQRILDENPVMQSYWDGLMESARSYLKKGDVGLPADESGRTTYKARFTTPLALLYAATGEPHLGEMIRSVVLELVERPMPFWIHSELRSYNPQWPIGQLETAELARSLSLTTLWCRDLFTDEEYAYVMEQIQLKGLDPALRWIEERADVQTNNYLAVIGGGALITAVVQEDKEAEKLGIHTLENWLDLVETDGSYGEPQGYFEYGCSRFFFGWWALGHERGKALLQGRNLARSLDWMVYYFILAEHEDVTSAWRINFGDDDFLTGPKGRTTFTPMVCQSLAYAYDDGLGTWIRENLIHPDMKLSVFEFAFGISQAATELPAPVSPQEKKLPLARNFDNGVVMIRSDWDFARSTVFALRSGGAARTGYSHDRPNRNAFALMSHGDYLVVAPGRSSYRSPLYRSWDIPTTTHNTVTLDGETQTRDRVAKVTEFVDTAAYVKFSSEAAGAYPSEPESVLRTVWYVKALDAFLIRDSILTNRPQTPSWHLLLSNFSDLSSIEPLASGGCKLQRPGANLSFWIGADQPLNLTERPGYMHSGYSYYPGDPFEGPEGSAISMTWATSEPVGEVHYYALLFPNGGTQAPEVTPLQGQTSWDIAFNGQHTRLSLADDQLSISTALAQTAPEARETQAIGIHDKSE